MECVIATFDKNNNMYEQLCKRDDCVWCAQTLKMQKDSNDLEVIWWSSDRRFLWLRTHVIVIFIGNVETVIAMIVVSLPKIIIFTFLLRRRLVWSNLVVSLFANHPTMNACAGWKKKSEIRWFCASSLLLVWIVFWPMCLCLCSFCAFDCEVKQHFFASAVQ